MKTQDAKRFGRRQLLQGAAALAAAGQVTRVEAAGLAESPAIITASDGEGVAETTAGKVRGYRRNGIFTFKGIPYAGDTGGTKRFLPPAKATPWTGVRSSMQYGRVCPQGPRAGWDNDENAFMFEWDDGQPGESCLRANIWTPGIKDNRKRPVLFWIHGGGFAAGSGQELKSYDGENLARRGDVVVVSINHRLNVLGYLNLAAYGEKYAASANAGMLDLVAALEWVRDNIGNFGGDPDNVTIFGQSGGGMKVSALMAMPSAKGLFHKAAIQSGSFVRMATAEHSAKIAAALMAELGIREVDQLADLPYMKLYEASEAAKRKVSPPNANPRQMLFRVGISDYMDFGATVDGKILPQHPFDPAGPAISADIPLMIGSCSHEFTSGIGRPEWFAMTDSDVEQRVAEIHGRKSASVIEAYRRIYPTARPADLYSYISTASMRYYAVLQSERKAAQNAAPAYLYLFSWRTPVLDGRPGAFHCSDLPFLFDNTDRCAAMTGGTAGARQLGAKMSEALLALARKGNPNHRDLPFWPVFNAISGPTMIFDAACEVRSDPDRDGRQAILA